MAMNDCNDMTHMIWIYCPYHIIHSISSVSCGPYHMANRRQTKARQKTLEAILTKKNISLPHACISGLKYSYDTLKFSGTPN